MNDHSFKADGLEFEVSRGRGWLIVVLNKANSNQAIAEFEQLVWKVLQQHLMEHLIVELNSELAVSDELILGLRNLAARLEDAGGILRVVSESESLELMGVSIYPNRERAVMGLEVA